MAHEHKKFPDDHWAKYQKFYECPICHEQKACGYKKTKFKDHVRDCEKNPPLCEICNKPKRRQHECRTANKPPGLYSKRTFAQKLKLVQEYNKYRQKSSDQLAIFLGTCETRGVKEGVQRSFKNLVCAIERTN